MFYTVDFHGQIQLSCELSAGVPSVVYHVETGDCGSVMDYIREKVESNSDKLDQLLACSSCNQSTPPGLGEKQTWRTRDPNLLNISAIIVSGGETTNFTMTTSVEADM